MPVVIKGLAETRAALRKFEPDLLKESDRQMRAVLQVIVVEARGFVPNESPLRNWNTTDKARKINKSTSMFNKSAWAAKDFNANAVKSGIRSKIGRGRKTVNGFKAVYSIVNATPAGAIYETAGRKNPDGDSKSKSRNPNAGKQFIDAIQKQSGQRPPHGKHEGRIAFAAVEKNNGKAVRAIYAAVLDSQRLFKMRTAARAGFGGE